MARRLPQASGLRDGEKRGQQPQQGSCWQRSSPTDVNECRRPLERRVCHHSCHNTVGSFLCTCRPGFRLRADRVSCEGEQPACRPGPWPQALPPQQAPPGPPCAHSRLLPFPSVLFQFVLLFPTHHFLTSSSTFFYPFVILCHFTVSLTLLFSFKW